MKRQPRSSIRRSQDSDLEEIHTWMVAEEARSVEGNFLCNWRVIQSAHDDGDLLVYIDGGTRLPVAYQLGRLLRPGILQVRCEFRRQGIGKKLAGRCISLARSRDECCLYIECNPPTSIPFWESMGFELIEGSHAYAIQTLKKEHSLPPEGTSVKVSIRLYPESRKWDESVEPIHDATPEARLSIDGTVFLAERVIFHRLATQGSRDPVAEVVIDGSSRFLDKMKYDSAGTLGFRQCPNGFYIDQIAVPKR